MGGASETRNLEGCPIFLELTSAELDEVDDLLNAQSFPAGEVILREGLSTQFLWILMKGRCEVAKESPAGKQQLAVLESINIFGEMSFFNPAPHSASVCALTNVETLRLSRDDFERLQQSGSAAAIKIAVNATSILAERVRQMDEWICELLQRPEASRHQAEWREFRSKLYSDWQF